MQETRYLKFRAWDFDNKKMIFWSLWDLLARFNTSNYGGDEYPSVFFDWYESLELKDKKGKEIYRGDIVVIDDFKNYEVIYDIDEARYQFQSGSGRLRLAIHFRDTAEIIGNIYENPELLNSKI